jgi:hypothetical protein
MIYLVNSFTKIMLIQLQRLRTIELSNIETNICVADDFKESLSALYNRGFVNTKTVMPDGKEIFKCLYYSGG